MHILGFLRPTQIEFVDRKHEHGDIYTFRFSATKHIKHIAGQHGRFVLPKLGGVHIFSLSSAPEEQHIAFTTHLREGSAYKQRLKNLEPGQRITLWGPVLDFVFQEDETDYIFLAQGIGITPFRSLLIHADKARLPVSTTLIHVEGESHTFRELTERLATKAYYPTTPESFTEAVKDSLDNKAYYYLSGSPRFIKATKRTLRTLGVKRSRMKSDSFLGY